MLSASPGAPTPLGGNLSGQGAAALLARISSLDPEGADDDSSAGVLADLVRAADDAMDGADEEGGDTQRVSRKDKSLGLLADNFLQLFASGACTAVELESVANKLGVGRRRIYDIVNVLESLDVVQKDRASSYTWLGLTKLPACVDRLMKAKPIVDLLVDEIGGGATNVAATAGKETGGSEEGAAEKDKVEGRKEKSIRELSTKFVGLFLQAINSPGLDGVISLEQAARSLLVHESGEKPGMASEPDAGAMKTKVRRLYDICNVLTSLRMIEKVKLPDTSKPAFKWLGVTTETEAIFDASAAAARPVKAYGGGINAPVCAKRGRSSLGGDGRRGSLVGNKMRATVVGRESIEPPPSAMPALAMPAAPFTAAANPFDGPMGMQWRWMQQQQMLQQQQQIPPPPPVVAATAAQPLPRHAHALPHAIAQPMGKWPVEPHLMAQPVCAMPASASASHAAALAVFAPSASSHSLLSPGIRGGAAPGAPSAAAQVVCAVAAEAKGAPTPAHVQEELRDFFLADTPRHATAALLTMAAGFNEPESFRPISNEI